MNVVLVEMEGARPVGVVDRVLHGAGGAENESLGHGEPHVVHAVIGEELAEGMELMRVPGPLPPDADLGEPLRDEMVVVDPPRTPDVAVRHLRRPLDLEPRGGVGRDGRGGLDLRHRPVVGVRIIGLDVAQAGRQVGLRKYGL